MPISPVGRENFKQGKGGADDVEVVSCAQGSPATSDNRTHLIMAIIAGRKRTVYLTIESWSSGKKELQGMQHAALAVLTSQEKVCTEETWQLKSWARFLHRLEEQLGNEMCFQDFGIGQCHR